MKVGYARVSTPDQKLNLQTDELWASGCEKVFEETVSGVKKDRPEFDKMLAMLRAGDTLIVWKLDRLGRSLHQLIKLVNELNEKGIGLKSLHDPIDTTSPQGRLIFNIFASLAEFERELIRERTHAGLKAARARGRVGGRKPGLSPEAEKTAMAAETLYKEGELTVSEICQKLNIARRTFYNYLRRRNVPIGSYKRRASS